MSRTYPGERNPNYRHGGCGTRTYRIWNAMRTRCNNPKFHAWPRYGGRGITVCRRWDSFANFLADMGNAPEGMSLERKNNDRGYSKANCKWATPLEQGANTRQNRMVGGVHLSERARQLGIKPDVLWKRLKRAERGK